ncbi:Ig-like domain-containing protein [Alkalimarinus coralli]|uniref:Ig-like domain-containing protein n=1 Tax=Alkalimarinus coralli TaxID=2935863 RepID=UPI00202B11C6|nr:Ig-like domain-containing protein [Alkalimarinus coralli]
MHLSKFLIPITATLFLSACGGGGSNDRSLCAENTNGCTSSSESDGATSENVALALGTGTEDSFLQGQIELGVSTLSANGQTTVSVNAVNSADNTLYTESPTTINFTSTCAANGLANLTESVTTSTGTAQVTYTATGCSGTDSITASLANGSSANATLLIVSADAGSLSFSSVNPKNIALKNLGGSGLVTTAVFEFKVTDKANLPIQGEKVNFSLSNTTGGIELVASSDTSDSNGIAKALVNSGTTKASVAVSASLDSNPTLQTTSDAISISTGIAAQQTLSISASRHNPPAGISDGEEIEVVVRVSDYYLNPIPDGSKVVFYTSAGQIDPDCTISGGTGSCTAKWRSQAPRATDSNGKFAIMATMKGEEQTSPDNNANGLFDGTNTSPVETYTALGEAFVDANWNGVRDSGEEYVDWDQNKAYTASPSSKFRGVRCTDTTKAEGHCAALADIFISEEFSYSGLTRNEDITFTDCNGLDRGTTFSLRAVDKLCVVITDWYGNAPADGTKYEISGIETVASTDISDRSVLPTIVEIGARTDGKLTVKVTNSDDSKASNEANITIIP